MMVAEMPKHMAEQYDRLPPHDDDAELGLIGAMMACDAAQLAEVRQLISKPQAFMRAECQVVYSALCDMADDGKPLESGLIAQELRRRGVWKDIGGIAGIADMFDNAPFGAVAAKHYAETIRDLSIKRDLIEAANFIIRRCYDPAKDSDLGQEIAEATMQKVAEITSAGGSAGFRKIGDIFNEVYDELGTGETPLVPMGFSELNECTGGGIGLGEMVIIAARPSMGKSTLVRQMAVRSAIAGVPTAVISLEEGEKKMARNILSAESGIDNHKLRSGKLDEQDWQEISAGIARIGNIPLYITDRARKIGDIRAAATIFASRHGVKLLIIDYLQRIRGARGQDKYEQVSNISTELSDMMKDLKIAGIVVAQLNRGPEDREDKRPIMRDLRDSGQIEQDADGIIFLNRPDYWHLDDANYIPTREAELIVAKWRDGIRGKVVRLRSDLAHQKFEDIGPVTPFD